jgi:lipopolysaccharide transport system ATP-binding protein
MRTAIKVNNVSKLYKLGEIGTGTLSHDLNRWWSRVRGKEDPYAKIGEENDRTKKGNSNYVWSIRDISFDVQQGEVLGVIGKNGAGKSTLLKILSRVTGPTKGEVYVKGRIASLLEVGTGFHPELTGKENIFLNGAILGMTKSEIRKKFDEIVHFSGVEKYIDTPVKRYSSGMYVRLAFAVAAHLESEILIVDEVLAVGDLEFQKKCLGKMDDVASREGRTILFVSHNMGAVKNLCKKGVILENGKLAFSGGINETIERYITSQINSSVYTNDKNPGKPAFIKKLHLSDTSGETKNTFDFFENVRVNIDIAASEDFSQAFNVGVLVKDKWGQKLFTTTQSFKTNQQLQVAVTMPARLLLGGAYSIDAALFIPKSVTLEYIKDVTTFTIVDSGSELAIFGDTDIGSFKVDCQWESQ